jgi:outer membrane PBP1 activator LpoA protein
MKLKLTSAIILLSGVLIAGCSTSSDQKVKDAKENADEANEAYLEEIENYKAEQWEIIKANELALEEMKAVTEEEAEKISEDYEAIVSDLEARNEALKTALKDYEDEGESNWKKFKKEFSHDMDELGTAFKDIFKNSNK